MCDALVSTIGSNMGLLAVLFWKSLLKQSTVPVIVDAGIGAPSDAALALEIGCGCGVWSNNRAMAVAKTTCANGKSPFVLLFEAGRIAMKQV